MATPPRITDVERDAAITRITDRHTRIDDPRRSELGTDPRDVISWVLDRGTAGVPTAVSAADHQDAVLLSTWCWWEERRRERRLLRQGQQLGLSAAELGAPLGIRSRQGLRDRLDRLDALLAHDRPDEQLTRDARRTRRTRDPQQLWIDRHHDHVRAVLAALIAQAARFLETIATTEPDEPLDGGGVRENGDTADELDETATDIDDWLTELRADYEQDHLTPATVAVAGLLVAEIRGHPSALALPPRHRLPITLRVVDDLRSAFTTTRSPRG
ncbi:MULTISPECIES: hypothetical protein [unclassified Pseudonocardia]|uniref:hypothetical protein n=1 Tax=unclassified Pseudonocardia TaxID=2619320 RepID=UPI000ABDD98D|nr:MULTISPECIES: hypothetical protein [unclassified Pseudonocardia]